MKKISEEYVVTHMTHTHIYIYIYIYILVIFGQVKPEFGVIPSGQENHLKIQDGNRFIILN